MAMSETDDDIPFWRTVRTLPDDAFPLLTGIGGRLIALPHRGNQAHVSCTTCRHSRMFSGLELCKAFPTYLRAPVEVWAAALRCGECGGRRLQIAAYNDASAHGFQTGPNDPAQYVWWRRLDAYLSSCGLDIEAFRDVIRDPPESTAHWRVEQERAAAKAQT